MSRYLACLAGDNSLEPTIRENDIAIVDRNRILADNNASIMAVETNGRTELMPYTEVEDSDDIKVLGQVVYRYCTI